MGPPEWIALGLGLAGILGSGLYAYRDLIVRQEKINGRIDVLQNDLRWMMRIVKRMETFLDSMATHKRPSQHTPDSDEQGNQPEEW